MAYSARRWAGVLATALAAVCLPAQAHDRDDDDLELVTLSNRADLVSGGDALVDVRVPRRTSLGSVRVKLNGRDVTSRFKAMSATHSLRGLVTGLVEGANELSAEVSRRGHDRDRARLTITNHPIGGPVLSGPQITPYFCATPVPQGATATSPATNASGLSAPALDAQCNVVAEPKLYYRTTAAGCSFAIPDPSPSVNFLATAPATTATPPANPCFKTYNPAAPAPADMATTTTDTGHTVPYIVRVERGVLNRGIYDIAVLFDPTKAWTDGTAPQAQWNGKVLYQFGASTGQPRRQFRPTVAWTNDLALSKGYMVAQNAMTDSSTNSNRVMMTETVMMMKEHIADHYGPITFTMGTGCSGGSINSNMNASIAPGQLDGITISCAYPDSETTAMEVADCVFLVDAYAKPQWAALMAGKTQAEINAKKAAINGHVDQTGCHGWYNLFGSNGIAGNYTQRVVANTAGLVVPFGAPTNNCQLPFAMVYDPVTNPTGARCGAWDWAASIFGKTPDGLRALDTRDNVGIEYGRKALLAGAITPEEFVTLNEIAGGSTHDALPSAQRITADPEALKIAYRGGLVMSGRNVAQTAVIDMRGWDDSQINLPPAPIPGTTFAIHFVWRSFSIRERLDHEYGDHDNQVMWRFGRQGLLPSAAMTTDAFNTMDQWLTNLAADRSGAPTAVKVRAAKPANAFDYCLLSTDATQSTKVTNAAACDADPFLKPGSSPRQVAGGPLAENILKCQLKPLNAADYAPVTFSSTQWARLQATFADGVCDWSKRGVGQHAARSPRTYEDGPGGKALGRAPGAEDRDHGHGHGHHDRGHGRHDD